MKEILVKLGFKFVTGTLWKHKDVGIISINEKDSPKEIVKQIYDRGYEECQIMIRANIAIKD